MTVSEGSERFPWCGSSGATVSGATRPFAARDGRLGREERTPKRRGWRQPGRQQSRIGQNGKPWIQPMPQKVKKVPQKVHLARRVFHSSDTSEKALLPRKSAPTISPFPEGHRSGHEQPRPRNPLIGRVRKSSPVIVRLPHRGALTRQMAVRAL
jgi:hypothetical protein